jgi:hypothetical protein
MQPSTVWSTALTDRATAGHGRRRDSMVLGLNGNPRFGGAMGCTHDQGGQRGTRERDPRRVYNQTWLGI